VPALIEEVERTNVVMANLQQRAGFPPRNPYTIDMNRNNKNYYACGGFGHLAKNYRNRRMEVEQDNNNLKEE